MIAVSLRDFLRTGTFGPVQLGLSREQVQQRIGLPDATGGTSRKYRIPAVWKYGDIELYYERGADRLIGIYMDDFETLSGGTSIDLDAWLVQGGWPLEEARQALVEAELGFSEQPWNGEPEGTLLVTVAGVHLGFIGEQRECCPPVGLHHVSRFTR